MQSRKSHPAADAVKDMSERVADRVKHLLEGNGEQILETSGTVMPHTTLGNIVKSQVTLKHDNRVPEVGDDAAA